MRKDHKDTLVDAFITDRVHDWVGNFRLVHVKITAERSPQNSLKRCDPVLRDNARDKPNVHLNKGLAPPVITINAGLLFDISEQRGFIVIE